MIKVHNSIAEIDRGLRIIMDELRPCPSCAHENKDVVTCCANCCYRHTSFYKPRGGRRGMASKGQGGQE